ncbi:MAG: hypothetical protein HY672_02425 [Chloroflexi bacterium]|nr:hypothetical protein [Chloroflexota bacterium]
MISSVIGPRLLAWGMTSAGLGLGLIVAAFVGKDTPAMALWGVALLGVGAVFAAAHYLLRSRHGGQ